MAAVQDGGQLRVREQEKTYFSFNILERRQVGYFTDIQIICTEAVKVFIKKLE